MYVSPRNVKELYSLTTTTRRKGKTTRPWCVVLAGTDVVGKSEKNKHVFIASKVYI